MSGEQHKEAIRKVFAECDKAQSMAPIAEFAAPDYTAHFPGMAQLDLQGMQAVAGAFYEAFPGMTHSLKEMVADDDLVATRLVVSGTHTRDFVTPDGVIPPTNKQLNLNAINLFRLRDGRPVEHWIEFDMVGFMKQLGVG